MNDVDVMFAALSDPALKLNSIVYKRTFECERTKSDGTKQVASIEILDYGPSAANRYSCHASADGHDAYGNAMPTVAATLAVVHWNDLD